MNSGQFQKGQLRPEGAGRKKGSTGKRTEQFLETLERENFNPALAMIKIYKEAMKKYEASSTSDELVCDRKQLQSSLNSFENNASKYLKIAGDMAKDLANFAYPKQKAIEHTTPEDNEIRVTICDYMSKTVEENGRPEITSYTVPRLTK